MITLRPPFRAENMEGLYNKVIKGILFQLPNIYLFKLKDNIIKSLIDFLQNYMKCLSFSFKSNQKADPVAVNKIKFKFYQTKIFSI